MFVIAQNKKCNKFDNNVFNKYNNVSNMKDRINKIQKYKIKNLFDDYKKLCDINTQTITNDILNVLDISLDDLYDKSICDNTNDELIDKYNNMFEQYLKSQKELEEYKLLLIEKNTQIKHQSILLEHFISNKINDDIIDKVLSNNNGSHGDLSAFDSDDSNAFNLSSIENDSSGDEDGYYIKDNWI